MFRVVIILGFVVAASALPARDPVIRKLDPENIRYNYAEAEDGSLHLVDSWVKISDLARSARYDPDESNQYHLFTRSNPTVSQPLVMDLPELVAQSNFDATKRVVVLIHGFLGSGTSGSNQALVPAFLAGDDVNIIVVDWSAGSHWGFNGIRAGQAAGRFLSWLNEITGARNPQYHILGFSVGGHTAGIVARNLEYGGGEVPYITALDPSARWEIDEIVSTHDAEYVEVIHTSAGVSGWGTPLGHVDFYPNGGRTMPGCLLSPICDHQRSYEYMAESVRTGGFTGWECRSHTEASIGSCNLPGRLQMGGLVPKTGARGIYFLRTNRRSPFSMG